MMLHDVTLPIQRVETRSGVLGVIVEGQAGRRLPMVLIHGGGMDRASMEKGTDLFFRKRGQIYFWPWQWRSK